jgi:hypothetical protein
MRKGIIAIRNDHFTSSPAGWNVQIAAIRRTRGERVTSTQRRRSSPTKERRKSTDIVEKGGNCGAAKIPLPRA